jgi:predicted nucleic acid-binding protein
MKIVVDSNVVFSAILNPSGKIGQLLILSSKHFEFYAPILLKTELRRHKDKIIHLSKLSEVEFETLREEVFECIYFISEEQIPHPFWLNAASTVQEVDMDDIAFVALSEYIDAKLWTGDKRLLKALKEKGNTRGVSTDEVYQLLMDIEGE